MTITSNVTNVYAFDGSLLQLSAGGLLDTNLVNVSGGSVDGTFTDNNGQLTHDDDGVTTFTADAGGGAQPIDYIGSGTLQTLTLLGIPLFSVPVAAFQIGTQIYLYAPNGLPLLSGVAMSISIDTNAPFNLTAASNIEVDGLDAGEAMGVGYTDLQTDAITNDADTIFGNGGDDTISAGDGNDVLYGGAGNDQLNGQGGNDTLSGGAGTDTLAGGAGNDTYMVSSTSTVITEQAAAGTDTIITALSNYSIFSKANVENLTGTSASGHTLTGNTLDNVLTGAAGADSLLGSSGNDTLLGNGGNDTLDGGSGDDSMAGGAGNDTYFVDSYGDAVSEDAGAGVDTIRTALSSYSIFGNANIENIVGLSSLGQTLTGNAGNNGLTGGAGTDSLVGSSGNDTLTGNGGNDTLDGGSGADAMSGGTGDDTYLVDSYGDTISEAAGAGVDTVITGLTSYSIFSKPHVENLQGSSDAGQTLTGNTGDNLITGGAGNDHLIGSGGADTLIANAGEDTLDGGMGDDSMVGGAGDDTYIVHNYGDVIVELTGGGTDTILTGLGSYSIFTKTEIENLRADPALVGNRTFTGNTGDNVLETAEGNDSINGSGGNDTLIGGLGEDTLTGGSGADVFVFDTAPGSDNIDRITDFGVADDRIELASSVYAELGGPGALAAEAFVLGTAAAEADDRIIFDQATGKLFYDADGLGGTDQVQIAVLNSHVTLTADHFLIG